MVAGSLSVIIPALNEERNLADAVRGALAVGASRFAESEVVIVDDGSTDRTGEIADGLAREDPHVKVVHHPSPRGLGAAFRSGVERATKGWCLLVPGDNENPAEGLVPLLEKAGQADLILSYAGNPEVRSPFRRRLSRAYTWILNRSFGLDLAYYNGPALYRREMLLSIPGWTPSFAYQTEILVPLLARGASYVFVPVEIRRPAGSASKAFRLKNVLRVGSTYLRLVWKVRVLGLR